MTSISAYLLLFLCPAAVFAQQQATSANQTITGQPETVIVTGTFEPIPLSESNRSVLFLNTEDQPLLYSSVVDYLRLDPSIDAKQRGVDGVQVDLSIRGSTFEQSLVLLNGLRVNDAQSGHHNMDIPVPLEAISRVEILHGAGSTLYGADAIGGAVNFITSQPVATELRARLGFGNFGFNQQRVLFSYSGQRWAEQITASRDFSTGFRWDRDFRSSSVSSETWIKSGWGSTDLLVGGSDRPFGADQFYGPFSSWERTKNWFASVSQDLGAKTTVALGYRRHSDMFVLLRGNPAIYENNHVSQSWQAAVRRRVTLGDTKTIAYGLEGDADAIDSSSLGHHVRERCAGYLNLDLQLLQRAFLSVGAREEFFSGGQAEFAPTLAGAVWLGGNWRLRASASRAFRLPTYTDLYYTDPANIGNPLLKPESAWDFEGGPEWNPGGRGSLQFTLFRRKEHNDVDYVKRSPSDRWQATNIENLGFTGVETAVRLRLPKEQRLEVGYSWLYATQQTSSGLVSKYVFNYPSNNAAISWIGQFRDSVTLRTRVGVTQKVGQEAYAIWDVALGRTKGRVRPYMQLANLSDTSYQEIPGVAMPGRSLIAGAELFVSKKRQR